MRTIKGVKYKDIFCKLDYYLYKNRNTHHKKGMFCFVCKKKLTDRYKFFTEHNIRVANSFVRGIVPYFYICTECVKTSAKAEVVMIPLLKIVYGGEINISRLRVSDDERVDFIY